MGKKSSIVLELQQLASDKDVSVTDLLRKALIVATKLDLKDLKDWVLSELEGYPDKKEIPKYRIVQSVIRAYNPYSGWIHCQFEDREMSENLSNITFNRPIGELEALVIGDENRHGMLEVTFTQEVTDTLMKMAHSDLEPTRFINKSKITSILETVRTTLLKWALQLEKEGILGEGMTFSEEEKEKAKAADSIHIEHFHGIWGNVQAQNVQIGYYASIHNQLKDAGVSQEERNELENILDELRTSTGEKRQSIVQRGLDWVKRNKVLIGTLGQLIMEWLKGGGNGSG